MDEKYRAILSEVSKSLHDELTGKVASGGHSTVYFGGRYVYKVTERKVMEKSSRINSILSTSANTDLTQHVPKTVVCKDIGDNSLVVEELKIGSHPEQISKQLLGDILELLQQVHLLEIDQVVTNFEGDEIPASEYWTNQVQSAHQYAVKLKDSDTLLDSDRELIDECLGIIKNISSQANEAPHLVLVYKDVHRHNTLVDEGGKLSALIDWDAAMSGPVELEYVVLWTRFKEFWPQIYANIDAGLNKDLFIIAGLVQGLRFWKSFTSDSRYVDEQRKSLRMLVDLYSSSEEDWESKL